MKSTLAIFILLFFVSSQVCRCADQQSAEKVTFATPDKEVIRQGGFVANFYYRRAVDPQKAVMLLGGSDGGLPIHSINEKTINMLVASGYCVLATAYFKEQGLPETLQSVPLEFFDTALAWLNKQPRVKKGGIAVIGTSKGGELALLLASRHPEVKAVVGIVPSGYVFQGIAPRLHTSSSWSYQGKDLPYVPYKVNQTFYQALQTYEFHDVYQQALENTEAAKKARIPVEKINGPILLLSGKKDQIWPSTNMCSEMIRTLKEKKFPFYYEHVAYEVDHRVGWYPEHWKKILEFLSEHYKERNRTSR